MKHNWICVIHIVNVPIYYTDTFCLYDSWQYHSKVLQERSCTNNCILGKNTNFLFRKKTVIMFLSNVSGGIVCTYRKLAVEFSNVGMLGFFKYLLTIIFI